MNQEIWVNWWLTMQYTEGPEDQGRSLGTSVRTSILSCPWYKSSFDLWTYTSASLFVLPLPLQFSGLWPQTESLPMVSLILRPCNSTKLTHQLPRFSILHYGIPGSTSASIITSTHSHSKNSSLSGFYFSRKCCLNTAYFLSHQFHSKTPSYRNAYPCAQLRNKISTNRITGK